MGGATRLDKVGGITHHFHPVAQTTCSTPTLPFSIENLLKNEQSQYINIANDFPSSPLEEQLAQSGLSVRDLNYLFQAYRTGQQYTSHAARMIEARVGQFVTTQFLKLGIIRMGQDASEDEESDEEAMADSEAEVEEDIHDSPQGLPDIVDPYENDNDENRDPNQVDDYESEYEPDWDSDEEEEREEGEIEIVPPRNPEITLPVYILNLLGGSMEQATAVHDQRTNQAGTSHSLELMAAIANDCPDNDETLRRMRESFERPPEFALRNPTLPIPVYEPILTNGQVAGHRGPERNELMLGPPQYLISADASFTFVPVRSDIVFLIALSIIESLKRSRESSAKEIKALLTLFEWYSFQWQRARHAEKMIDRGTIDRLIDGDICCSRYFWRESMKEMYQRQPWASAHQRTQFLLAALCFDKPVECKTSQEAWNIYCRKHEEATKLKCSEPEGPKLFFTVTQMFHNLLQYLKLLVQEKNARGEMVNYELLRDQTIADLDKIDDIRNRFGIPIWVRNEVFPTSSALHAAAETMEHSGNF
ncbi:hypothetical protein L5515_005159 [Caenorhabditis briggsae]|uniref:Uncharacterized protein n=1 Tax=Caenorhabditis briggsae TaxID=6238 RepID=A0AAE9ENF9_CAEBR|nr:hypothetical protein L5515_005159 [Caenorhabditis briggsae]